MAPSKEKAKNRPEKKRTAERMPRPGIRSRVKSTRRKRANTPYRRQSCESVSIPQLVYELLTIDKYNQGDANRCYGRELLINYTRLGHKILYKKKFTPNC